MTSSTTKEIWDDVEVGEFNFVKLTEAGQKIRGTITAIGIKDWGDGTSSPQLDLTTPAGEEVVWTAGEVQAKRQLKELRPRIGDFIEVELTRIEKRGNKTLKHIVIEVTKAAGTGAGAAPAATTAADSAAPPAGIDPAAWAGMDATKRAEVLGRMATAGSEPPF